jgi:hypothetical protein
MTGHRPTHWGARPCQSELVFPPQKALLQTEILISFISCWMAGLRRSCRWWSGMWRSRAGVVIRGLRLWGQLDVLPNSLKLCWRQFMVEELTLNSLATSLVDISAFSMPIARSLKPWDLCGILLCDKTAHFRVAFYCPQHKVQLCNDHAI